MSNPVLHTGCTEGLCLGKAIHMAKRRSWGALRQLPHNKRWQASYPGPDGFRHNAPDTFSTKKEGDVFLSRTRTQIADGLWVDPKAPVVSDVVPQFMDFAVEHLRKQANHKGEALRPSTKSVYMRQLKLHCAHFAETPVNQITKSQIDSLFTNLREQGKKTTASKVYKLLRAIFDRALSYGYVSKNPCSIPGANTLNSNKEVFVPKMSQVWAIADAMAPNFRMMVIMAAYGGFRFGEVTELRRSDLTLIRDESGVYYKVSVSRAVTLVNGEFLIGKPKSAKSIRQVDISIEITDEVSNYLDGFVGSEADALLFPRTGSGTLRDDHLRHDVFAKHWARTLKRLKLEQKGLTFHSLRHYAGTYFHEAGGTIPELMAWLGDSSISAVTRYLHDTGKANLIANKMPVPKKLRAVA
jgi:integrase